MMKRLASVLLTMMLCAALISGTAFADDETILGVWYQAEHEYPQYPGVSFVDNGALESINVYSNGSDYIVVVDNDPQAYILFPPDVVDAYTAHFKDGVLKFSGRELVLSDGKLTYTSYLGDKLFSVTTYTREPREAILPYYTSATSDKSSGYVDYSADFYNGQYVLKMYGMYNAYSDAAAMNMEGTAVISDRHMTVNWTRDGVDKSFEITFDEEMNKGRLYTVVDNHSYVVSVVDYPNTIMLNVGMEQAQWVFEKEANQE